MLGWPGRGPKRSCAKFESAACSRPGYRKGNPRTTEVPEAGTEYRRALLLPLPRILRSRSIYVCVARVDDDWRDLEGDAGRGWNLAIIRAAAAECHRRAGRTAGRHGRLWYALYGTRLLALDC